MTSWKMSEILNEEDLDKFPDDEVSKEKFRIKFSRQETHAKVGFIVLVLLMVSNTYFESSFVFFLIFITFIVLMVVMSKLFFLKDRTPAVCQACNNLMSRYDYTDHDKYHSINGTVFICHNCKIKFIESKPDCTTG